jgi:hypothetical protein
MPQYQTQVISINNNNNNNNNTSMALVHQQTERPLLVSEVSANFWE